MVHEAAAPRQAFSPLMSACCGSVTVQLLPAAIGVASDTPWFPGTVTGMASVPLGEQWAIMLKLAGMGAGPPVAFTTFLKTFRWPVGWVLSQARVLVTLMAWMVLGSAVTWLGE